MKTFEEWAAKHPTIYSRNPEARIIWDDARGELTIERPWISANVRLPKLLENVLVYGVDSVAPMRGWLDRDGKWRRERGDDGPTTTPVTHWMPLPTPPRCPPDPFDEWWGRQQRLEMGGCNRYVHGDSVHESTARAIWEEARKAR